LQVPTASPIVTTIYTLTVTDGLLQTNTDTATVTVASAVVAAAGLDKTIALAGSTTLDGSATGGVPAYTYAWLPTTGLSNPAIAVPTASPIVTTVYTLTVTDSLLQTSNDSATVTVASAVVANAGLDKATGTGGSVTLDGSATGGVPAYTYAWLPTTGLSNPAIAAPTATPAATTVYTLTVTDSLAQTANDSATVTVTVFADVPVGYWARSYIEAINTGGITSGCVTSPPPWLYCPEGSVTRAQMAVFVCRGLGLDISSPPGTPTFADVGTGYWAYAYIEAFAAAGITTGCGGSPPLFCPEQTVTRAEMAVFLCRALSLDFSSPPGTPTFSDVGTGYWAYAYVEAFTAAGITTGCGGSPPAYCPEGSVTRAQMAVFLGRAFLALP
jgi:hypothetical protein